MVWYVVRTKPASERKAADELRKAGLRVYLPKRTDVTLHHRTGAEVFKRRALFVGYVLVRFPEALHVEGRPRFDLLHGRRLRETWRYDPKTYECLPVAGGYAEHRFVAGVLTGTTNGQRMPVPLPNREVANYMHRQRLREFDTGRKPRRATFADGMAVVIRDGGPFDGHEATIDRLDANGAWLLTAIFGRPTPVRVERFETRLEPVAIQRKAA